MMINIRKHIESFLKGKVKNSLPLEEMVGADIYDEFWKRAAVHIEAIQNALSEAGCSYTPILSPDIDEYDIVRFNVSVTWDKLGEVQKRIREGLPDQTIQQRLFPDTGNNESGSNP
jgi:hypothetical protein